MRTLSVKTTSFLLTAWLASCVVHGGALAADNFVSRFIQANGGCGEQAPLMTFEYGAGLAAPFGKALEEWAGSDLKALKEAMATCLPRPNGFDLGQENQILSKVATAVEDGRRSRQNRERQAAAAQQMAQARAEADLRMRRDRARRQEEAAAHAELRTFYGHIMSEAERARALQLKAANPNLSEMVDNLLAAQGRLQKEAAEQRRLVEEREEAARRIKAEEAKRALQAKREEQEAEIEAASKREAFTAALPNSCKEAQRSDKDLTSDAARNDFAKAAALAEAGDIKSACGSFTTYASKLESVRAQLVQCTKDLDANLDDLAREEAGRSLDRASEVYARQKFLKQKTIELECK